jgi:hypothetical protein
MPQSDVSQRLDEGTKMKWEIPYQSNCPPLMMFSIEIQQTLQKTKNESKTAKQQNSKTGETVYSEWRVNETR